MLIAFIAISMIYGVHQLPGSDVPACRPWRRPRTGYCPCVPPARSLCPPHPDCSVSRVALWNPRTQWPVWERDNVIQLYNVYTRYIWNSLVCINNYIMWSDMVIRLLKYKLVIVFNWMINLHTNVRDIIWMKFVTSFNSGEINRIKYFKNKRWTSSCFYLYTINLRR